MKASCDKIVIVKWDKLPNLQYIVRDGIRYINSAFDPEKEVFLAS